MNITETTYTVVPRSALAESAYRGPCRILGAHITRVARGGKELIICAEYCDGVCRLRRAALENLATGLSDGVAPGETRCVMLTA